MEYYAVNVPNKSLYNLTQQPHTAYLVVDTKYKKTELNLGVGKGVTATSDNWVIKLIAAFQFD
jgi:hypothetical protein